MNFNSFDLNSRRLIFTIVPNRRFSWPRIGATFEEVMNILSDIDVLLVEDSPGDVRLTQEAFRAANITIRLHVASDGLEAMSFLRKEGANVEAPRPDIILLDLNLPKMDGRDVLALIKADDDLMTIPTVILTTSEAEADILTSYQLKANCYLSKPVQLDEFETLVKSINDFWLTKVRLPPQIKFGREREADQTFEASQPTSSEIARSSLDR